MIDINLGVSGGVRRGVGPWTVRVVVRRGPEFLEMTSPGGAVGPLELSGVHRPEMGVAEIVRRHAPGLAVFQPSKSTDPVSMLAVYTYDLPAGQDLPITLNSSGSGYVSSRWANPAAEEYREKRRAQQIRTKPVKLPAVEEEEAVVENGK